MTETVESHHQGSPQNTMTGPVPARAEGVSPHSTQSPRLEIGIEIGGIGWTVLGCANNRVPASSEHQHHLLIHGYLPVDGFRPTALEASTGVAWVLRPDELEGVVWHFPLRTLRPDLESFDKRRGRST